MAQIFSSNTAAMPSTPSKGDTSVRNPDTVPDYSPGAVPQYVANDISKANGPDPLFEALARKRAPDVSIMPIQEHRSHDYHNHPVLPIGNVFQDIRHHLQCHSLFNTNVEVLLSQFMTMKHDLNAANTELAKARREAQREREEKEGYKLECEALKTALAESQGELSQTRADLVANEERLRLAIAQLDQAAQRLEKLRNELRLMTHERDELVRKLADRERELEYYTARAIELQSALDVANAGENAANDRNTRLTHLLYQIEASKAHIERSKDHAEAHVRELEDAIKRLRADLKSGVGAEHIVFQLRREIAALEIKVLQLTSELNEAQRTLVNRDGQIQSMSEGIEGLRKDIENHKSRIEKWERLVKLYNKTIAGLPEEYRERFNGKKKGSRKRKGNLKIYTTSHDDGNDDGNDDDAETSDLEDDVDTTMGTQPDEAGAYSTGFEAPAEEEAASTTEQAVPKAVDEVEEHSIPEKDQDNIPTTTSEEATKEENKTE